MTLAFHYSLQPLFLYFKILALSVRQISFGKDRAGYNFLECGCGHSKPRSGAKGGPWRSRAKAVPWKATFSVHAKAVLTTWRPYQQPTPLKAYKLALKCRRKPWLRRGFTRSPRDKALTVACDAKWWSNPVQAGENGATCRASRQGLQRRACFPPAPPRVWQRADSWTREPGGSFYDVQKTSWGTRARGPRAYKKKEKRTKRQRGRRGKDKNWMYKNE